MEVQLFGCVPKIFSTPKSDVRSKKVLEITKILLISIAMPSVVWLKMLHIAGGTKVQCFCSFLFILILNDIEFWI